MEPDLPGAWADANQLDLALLNLGVNARDALAEGGVVTLRARAATADEPRPAGVADTAFIVLAVSDTGVGMDETTRLRAAEPFFSTKAVGQGTGLGLSMVHGLAAQLGGALEIDSAPGRGTTVALWLPGAAGPAAPVAPPADRAPISSRGGRVLVVDDEPLVRAATAAALVDRGYRVEEAENGEAAWALIEGGARPDLIVTDHLMPGLSGVELAQRLRARTPSIPVLLLSGYAEVEVVPADLPRLAKPFRQEALVEALEALRRAAGSGF